MGISAGVWDVWVQARVGHPALARQRGPRIWISDGGVTGKGDRGGPTLRHQAQQICKRARIECVPSAQEAVKQLRVA